MLTREQKKTIYEMIPTEFVVKGQTLTIPIRYSNQWEVDVWPCIILEYSILTGNVFTPHNKRRLTTNETADTFTMVSGTTEYQLSKTKTKEILSVVGMYSGDVHTFDPDDYELVDDKIVWTGWPRPTYDTEFVVTYTSMWLDITHGGEKYDNLSVNVYTKDYGSVDEGTFINGVLLADEIAGALHKFFEFEAENSPSLVIIAQPDINNLDELTPGEYQRRRQFDVHIRHLEEHITTIEDIEEVEDVGVTVHET